MIQRIPLDHLTSDQLDDLYDRLDHAIAHAATLDAADSEAAAAGSYAARAERAEAAIERVRALAAEWGEPGHCSWLSASVLVGQLRAALDPAQQPTTSPAAAVEVRQPCPYCGDHQMIPRRQYAEHVARLHPDEPPTA